LKSAVELTSDWLPASISAQNVTLVDDRRVLNSLKDRCQDARAWIDWYFIALGKPMQNGFVETFMVPVERPSRRSRCSPARLLGADGVESGRLRSPMIVAKRLVFGGDDDGYGLAHVGSLA
jgi:hypothetical protein